jgi:hypothetical protein
MPTSWPEAYNSWLVAYFFEPAKASYHTVVAGHLAAVYNLLCL